MFCKFGYLSYDLQYYIWSWDIPKINAENIIPDSLSWVRKDAKWYANQYIEDNLQEYVDIAKNSLSWTKEAIKWYYNEWVDELNWIISNKVNWAISWELSKFKIK